MSATIPSSEPESLVAGDSLVFTKSLSDYPAGEGWVLTYSIIKPDGSNFQSFTAGTDGDEFSINVTAGTTATWVPGTYTGHGRVSKAAEVYTVWRGKLEVLPGVAADSGDTRSHARKVLQAVEQVIESRAGKELAEWTVLANSFKAKTDKELQDLRTQYRTEVRNEEIELLQAAGKSTGRKILTRFPSPS